MIKKLFSGVKFRGGFHPLKVDVGTKKKYVSLIFMSTTTYQKIIKIGEVGLGWFPC